MHLFSPSASLCYFVSCPSSSPPSSFFRPSITKEAASVCHAAYQVSQHSGYANVLLVLTQTVCVPCLLGLADKEWCPFSSPRTCLAFVSLKAPAPILEPRFHINGCIPCPYADVLPLMVHKLIKKKKKKLNWDVVLFSWCCRNLDLNSPHITWQSSPTFQKNIFNSFHISARFLLDHAEQQLVGGEYCNISSITSASAYVW